MYCKDFYPPDGWIQVYRDGFVTKGVYDGEQEFIQNYQMDNQLLDQLPLVNIVATTKLNYLQIKTAIQLNKKYF